MRYVMSDIHGHLELFVSLMEKIRFSRSDSLYICGDMIEKGPDSVKLLKVLSSFPNIHCIRGNHEEAFLDYYYSLMRQSEDYGYVLSRLREYLQGDGEMLDFELVDWLDALPYYIEEKDFICVHAGVTLDENGRVAPLSDIPKGELLHSRQFKRPEVLPKDSKCVFYGHTSSMSVYGDTKIREYRRNSFAEKSIKDYVKVHLDLGTFTSGALGCFCIDTCESFYIHS